ncbi:MAG: phosphonopyruvate decarboxylase [Bacteroidales bacterium]|nr:phosphonopyruvate decarboxylase [Bacteroidales bacterium]
MLNPKFFIDYLKSKGVDFFAGVPDSLLKNICAYISDSVESGHNIVAANEGAAIGLAAGHYLATGKPGLVYMQNSGEGNAINPLASLTDKDVYNIPVLLLIGWRGEPGVHDEPQHIKQGKITTDLLDVLEVKYEILSKEENQATKQIDQLMDYMTARLETVALVVEKDTFEPYSIQHIESEDYPMSREEALGEVTSLIGDYDIVVSTTGMISRELFEYRTANGQNHNKDFLTVGSMGHASQIALGIALEKKSRRVWCFDGDGACLMHMGSMAILASKSPKNLVHIVFNNGAHDSVGGQPTVGFKIDLPFVAKAVGYPYAVSVDNKSSLSDILREAKNLEGPVFIEIKVRKGNRKDLGRPTTTPIENKKAFMAFLSGKE